MGEAFLASGSETVVIAHDERLGVEAVAEILFHEAVGVEGGHFAVEAEHAAAVDAIGGQLVEFLVEGGEQAGLEVGRQGAARMFGKGHDTRVDATALRLGLHLADEVLVAAVDAVEEPDGRHAGRCGSGMQVVYEIHKSSFSSK